MEIEVLNLLLRDGGQGSSIIDVVSGNTITHDSFQTDLQLKLLTTYGSKSLLLDFICYSIESYNFPS